jgi:hypothetical protein
VPPPSGIAIWRPYFALTSGRAGAPPPVHAFSVRMIRDHHPHVCRIQLKGSRVMIRVLRTPAGLGSIAWS